MDRPGEEGESNDRRGDLHIIRSFNGKHTLKFAILWKESLV